MFDLYLGLDSPKVNERLDDGFWLPPILRLWFRALMRKPSELELSLDLLQIFIRYLFIVALSVTKSLFTDHLHGRKRA